MKYKIFTIVNVLGLTLGITAVLLITMYVLNELNFENCHKNANNIYRVNFQIGMGDRPMKLYHIMSALGPAAKSSIPEVTNSVRIASRYEKKLKYNSKEFIQSNFYYADTSFFNVFTFELLKGNLKNPFQNINSIVISKSVAEKIFGDKNPIGQILQTDEKDYCVSAVADVPANTQFQWSVIAPIENLEKTDPNFLSWNQSGCETYLLLKENASQNAVDKKLNDLYYENIQLPPGAPRQAKLYTQRLTDIYLYSDVTFEYSPQGNATFIYLLSAIAVIILIIATFNFVNLSTVRSIQRAKEVGLKKVLGATRFNLISQFLFESLLITLCALVISILLYQIFNPLFSEFLGYRISKPVFLNSHFYLSITGIYFIVSFVSGVYPAFYLSRYKPVETLKGSFKSPTGKFTLKKVIVVFQFAITIFLICGTMIIYKQLNFVKNTDLGFDKSNVLLAEYPFWLEGGIKYQVLKNKLLENPDISDLVKFYNVPGIKSDVQVPISLKKNSKQNGMMINAISVDYDFIPMMKINILAGRNFSREYSTDSSNSVIINETAAKMLGLKDPVGTTVYADRISPTHEAKIIGIVSDFHIESLRNKIVPCILSVNSSYIPGDIAIKIRNPQQTLKFIKSTWEEVFPLVKFRYTFYEDDYNALYNDDEKLAEMITIFTLIAIFIAYLGLFGLISFTALMRTKEIGIRKVIGATTFKIVTLLSKEFLKWILIANIIAWPLAYYFMDKWLQDFAYRIEISWWIFALSGGIALLIALVTVSFQAIKAATANPVESLRYE